MKHLLNNLSEEEKQSILEQHNGGMKVFSENFKRLIGHKSGTILNEQSQSGTTFTQPGDPYEYKQEGDFYYTRKKGAPNWIKVTPQVFGNSQDKYNKALEAIKQVISNNNANTNAGTIELNSGVAEFLPSQWGSVYSDGGGGSWGGD